MPRAGLAGGAAGHGEEGVGAGGDDRGAGSCSTVVLSDNNRGSQRQRLDTQGSLGVAAGAPYTELCGKGSREQSWQPSDSPGTAGLRPGGGLGALHP